MNAMSSPGSISLSSHPDLFKRSTLSCSALVGFRPLQPPPHSPHEGDRSIPWVYLDANTDRPAVALAPAYLLIQKSFMVSVALNNGARSQLRLAVSLS